MPATGLPAATVANLASHLPAASLASHLPIASSYSCHNASLVANSLLLILPATCLLPPTLPATLLARQQPLLPAASCLSCQSPTLLPICSVVRSHLLHCLSHCPLAPMPYVIDHIASYLSLALPAQPLASLPANSTPVWCPTFLLLATCLSR